MGSAIRANELTATIAAQTLQSEIDAFLSFELISLAWALPGSGSQDHDSRLTQAMREALDAYRQMLTNDVGTIQASYKALAAADAESAKGLGGR